MSAATARSHPASGGPVHLARQDGGPARGDRRRDGPGPVHEHASSSRTARLWTALSPTAREASRFPDGCTATGRQVTCPARPTVAAGTSTTWTCTVRLDRAYQGDGTDLRDTATVGATTPDPDAADNTSPAALPPGGRVQPGADVELSRTAG
ncbi:hypothetical protein AB0L47_15880 [Streptomyces bobili]|uniref:hypothetical protein n=1 Tax=Streptomyces bobili TaxID=67280 RepID=UPI00344A5F8F